MSIIEPKECPDILKKLQIATQKSYWRDCIFRHLCVSDARIAPILGGSHPSLCLPRRRRSPIPPILLPRLNLSWYPLHLHRLEPAGVEWESRCWGDKSPQPSKAAEAKKKERKKRISPNRRPVLFLCNPVSFTFKNPLCHFTAEPQNEYLTAAIKQHQTGSHSRNVIDAYRNIIWNHRK